MKILINRDIYIDVLDKHNYALYVRMERTSGGKTHKKFSFEGYFNNTEHALARAINVYFYAIHSNEIMDLKQYLDKLTQFRADFLKDIENLVIEKKLKK